MIDGGTYHIEIAGRLATIYVVGDITTATQRLLNICNALPVEVEVLSLNLDRMEQLGTGAQSAIDAVRTHWQSSRRGSFRVTFALLSPTHIAAYDVELGVSGQPTAI